MARSRHCDVCNGWHDMEEPWPSVCLGHYRRRDEANGKSTQIMGDMQPYRNIVDGKVIGGRRQHREFLRSRGLVEVGNEKVQQTYQPPPPPSADIKRVMDQLGYKG